jgi:two-component system chemotaxis sensor kinase CheA
MDPADLYQQTFRLEADELIGEIEIVILLVEENPDDADAINRLFRAVHTLKGIGRDVRPDRYREFLARPGIGTRQGSQPATAG